MSKHGKVLTREQRKIMAANGIIDCSDWLYIKQETVDSSGAKSTGLNRDKYIQIVVQNIKTGEVKCFKVL